MTARALGTDMRAVRRLPETLQTQDLLPGDALVPAALSSQARYSRVCVALSADSESAQLLLTTPAVRSATSDGLAWWAVWRPGCAP